MSVCWLFFLSVGLHQIYWIDCTKHYAGIGCGPGKHPFNFGADPLKGADAGIFFTTFPNVARYRFFDNFINIWPWRRYELYRKPLSFSFAIGKIFWTDLIYSAVVLLQVLPPADLEVVLLDKRTRKHNLLWLSAYKVTDYLWCHTGDTTRILMNVPNVRGGGWF